MLWLLVAAPIVAAPSILAMRAGRIRAGGLSALLRVGLFATLVLMIAELQVPVQSAAHRMAVVVAVDQSSSIAPTQMQWMEGRLAAIRAAMNPHDQLAVIGFGRDAQLIKPLGDPRLPADLSLSADPSATDISGALTTAIGLFPPADEKHLILFSDGNETQGSARDELPALAADGVRVYSAAPPLPSSARVALTNFEAPSVVHAGVSFALRLDLDSEATSPVDAQVKLLSDGNAVGGQQITLRTGLNRFELPYRIEKPGAYLLKAEVSVPPPLVSVNASAETALSVSAPPRVLVIAAVAPESLIKALQLRGYNVAQTGPHNLPSDPRAYLAYQAVVLANVTADALGENAQYALNRYVADYGGGLIVTGDTLRDPKFRGSELEKTLPINFVPQPPPPTREPIAVYLLIDRSNSMSYNSRYPAVRDYERIRYAKQAAIALLNQLDDTDYAGVIAFDSEPYVLGHLRPVGEDREELVNRVSRLEPGGGTDFKEALEIAEREILASGIAVREVILLTDGDTNRQYHDHDQLMADYAKEQIPVSTIRIGPDLENLRLLQDFARNTGGIFYRVEDITKLPQLLVNLTHEAENFKRHEHTRVTVESQSAILNGIDPAKIPPMDFYDQTDPKEGAEVPLEVTLGTNSAPLLATWQYELGRSAVFTGDPDSLGSLAWIRWDHYAEFWSQLVCWVARPGDAGPFTLLVVNSPDGSLTIEAEKADTAPVTNLFARITGPARAVDVALTQVGDSLYRGNSAPLPRGKYDVVLMVKAGDTERVLLERPIAVAGRGAADAAELRLRPPNYGLLRALAENTGGRFDTPVAEDLRPVGATVIGYRGVNGTLLPIAIVLMLGEVFIRRRLLGD
ncbi:MAG TPA: VWA domain-containing protein [Candidatus Binataceae bacterium]|nr:VWA domain-containing protein [Candidatus Binataceae bacterium]